MVKPVKKSDMSCNKPKRTPGGLRTFERVKGKI